MMHPKAVESGHSKLVKEPKFSLRGASAVNRFAFHFAVERTAGDAEAARGTVDRTVFFLQY